MDCERLNQDGIVDPSPGCGGSVNVAIRPLGTRAGEPADTQRRWMFEFQDLR